MKTRRLISLSVVAAAALAPAAAIAKNGADDGVRDDHGGSAAAKRVAGTCSAGATAKLKVKPDGARLETEFEVDQNRNGVTWKVTLRRNGAVAARTSATTKAPSGSFSVNRRLVNGPGRDRITARATSPSGAVCTAAISV
jgi:hypothetical protein